MKKILSLCLAVLLCAALCGCQRKISLPAVKEIGSIQVETTDGREITLDVYKRQVYTVTC